MGRTRGWSAVVVIVTVAVMVLAACSSGAGGDKAGGNADLVTLRIGTDDGPGRPAADQILEFARRVEQRSEGRIRIEPVWHAAGEGVPDWDQAVARMVVAGDIEMGMIPARAWDTEGVLSLRALQAPFLVNSDELVARIVTSDLAAEMLSGLSTIGVTGLALLPEGLRHMFAFGGPPLSRADFEGKQVRAPSSETTSALFQALGATADDFANDDDAFREGIASGTIAAAESSFALAGTLPAPTTAVGNMTFFPKVNSLVVNADAFDELTGGQQRILRDAADDMVGWAVTATPSDVDLAEQYCANGGRIVLADEAELEAMRAAVQPVYTELERDETTKALIGEIEALREDLEPATTAVETCGAQTDGEASAGSGGESETAFPEGVYRMEVSAEFLIEAGVDPPDAYNHAGIWTLRFTDGQLVVDDINALSQKHTVEQGVYCVAESEVMLGLIGDPPTCGDFWTARWKLDSDELRFVEVRSAHGSDLLVQTLFGGQPWTKIG
ncbi:MAG TPA: TRAP transporter substrate-binding protein DctP [Actinomycetota bacterium]|nr:TRAP transporter substrate-binding protein DctP [Actinomycetota bacterium]